MSRIDRVRIPEQCSMLGQCRDAFGQVRTECPPTSFSGEPIDLAENLCPGTMQRTLVLREQATAVAHYRAAWAGVELGLSQGQAEPHEARQNIRKASSILGVILEQKEGRLVNPIDDATFLGAAALRAFIPAFIARAQPDNTFGEVDCARIYRTLVRGLEPFKTRKERGRLLGHIVEMEVMALLLRTSDSQRLAYPASPREESRPAKSGEGSLNHDMYILRPDREVLTKLPIQVKFSNGKSNGKTKRPYSAAVAKLYYKDEVLAKLGRDGRETLIDPLIAEAKGNGSAEDREMLDVASRAVLEFVDQNLARKPT